MKATMEMKEIPEISLDEGDTLLIVSPRGYRYLVTGQPQHNFSELGITPEPQPDGRMDIAMHNVDGFRSVERVRSMQIRPR